MKAEEGCITAAGFSMGDGVRSPEATVGGAPILQAVKAGRSDWWDFLWPPDDGAPYAQYDWDRSAITNALMGMDVFLREVELAGDKAMLIKHGKQIQQARAEGKVGVILHGNSVTMS